MLVTFKVQSVMKSVNIFRANFGEIVWEHLQGQENCKLDASILRDNDFNLDALAWQVNDQFDS